MKQNWTNPELQSLEISATAGGVNLNDQPDGPAEWKDGMWWVPVGEGQLSDGTV